MKVVKGMIVVLTMAVYLGIGVVAQAVVIDFTGEAFRGGNTTGNLPTITENPTQDGFITVTNEAGQKVSYGTEYFNGWQLSAIDYLQFTFKDGSSKSPYSNLTITDGFGAYGVISSQGGYLSDIDNNLTDPTNPYYQATRAFYFAGHNGNSDNNYNFKFYEPNYDNATLIIDPNDQWNHGTSVSWSDIGSWYLLGVDETRPLYSGEGSNPRAPLYTGLNLIWGDSQANYLGNREVWDVIVQGTDGTIYQAGPVPEPTTMILLGSGLIGLVGFRRKFKKS